MIEEHLPEDASAIVLHADGRIEAYMPNQEEGDYVPQHVMLTAAFLRIAGDLEALERTLREFQQATLGPAPTLN